MAIVDSIVRYAAGAKMDAGAWNTLVLEVAQEYANGHEIGAVLKNAEEKFKEMTGETTMPSAYRSAKCVIVKAYTLGITTLNSNNEARGKTEVEKAIKEAAPKAEPEMSDVMEDGLAKLRKAYLMCGTPAEQVACKSYIEMHISEVWA